MDYLKSGNIVDVINKRIYKGELVISNGVITEIRETENKVDNVFILPGLIDSHIHIESSMLVPSAFAAEAVKHGTVATVSDPHEIANVLGVKGVEFMVDDGAAVPFKFFFGAPSCVPATAFETSGFSISDKDIDYLFRNKDIHYLAEVMNFPGVIHGDPNVLKKIEISKKYNKKIDGHAPNVRGEDLDKYINAGITTDHECFDIEEAKEKIQKGMIIQIREGSAAKNFEALFELIDLFPDRVMLCSDDLHPDDLIKGHINALIKRALSKGLNFFNVLRSCTYNVVKHYDIKVGLLQKNDPADFIVVDNLDDFNILATYCDGLPVYQNDKSLINYTNEISINNFKRKEISLDEISVRNPSNSKNINVISVIDGELITKLISCPAKMENDFVVQDIDQDILKIVVLNRYEEESIPSIGFIKNFGLKKGAIASSVAHDSHNIVAVGANDEDLINAINEIISNKGGLSLSENDFTMSLKLEIGGLMTNEKADFVAQKYSELDAKAKQMGSTLTAPYMTLSFMSLLVIPEFKISDKFLFNSLDFEPIPLFHD